MILPASCDVCHELIKGVQLEVEENKHDDFQIVHVHCKGNYNVVEPIADYQNNSTIT